MLVSVDDDRVVVVVLYTFGLHIDIDGADGDADQEIWTFDFAAQGLRDRKRGLLHVQVR